MNKHSLVNYFEEVERDNNKWNGKVKCIQGSITNLFKKGKIYEIQNGKLNGIKYQFKDLNELNSTYSALFKEVESNKIKLLLKRGYENITYIIHVFEDYNLLEIRKNNRIQHDIRWGNILNTTLSDVQPILDIFNIEIVEELPKYKIDVEGEYSEEELEVLKSAGIKFKKVGE